MSDATQKAAEEIEAGDVIWDGAGNSRAVRGDELPEVLEDDRKDER